MKIEVFEVDTEDGRKRVSMKSTGTGAWITVSKICVNPLRLFHIRKVKWIACAKDAQPYIEKCTD
jgi:hypothetical protein